MVCLHSTRQCVLTALKVVCPLCVKILCTQQSLWCLHSLTTVEILLLIVLPCLILIRIIKMTALENYIVLFIWKLSYISGISLKLMVYIADYSFSRIKHFFITLLSVLSAFTLFFFFLPIQFRPYPMGWQHKHLGWVSYLQLIISRNTSQEHRRCIFSVILNWANLLRIAIIKIPITFKS